MFLNSVSFALTALIVAYFLWDRYRPRPVKIEVEQRNTILARVKSINPRVNGQIGIAFYHVRLVNMSRSPVTIDTLQLQVRMGMTASTITSHVLLTGQVYAPLEKKTVDAALVEVEDSGHVVLMNWQNLRSRLADHESLQPGGVLSGSALFLLNSDELVNYRQLGELSLVATDSRGKKSILPLSIDQEVIDRGMSASIVDRSFSSQVDGSVVFT